MGADAPPSQPNRRSADADGRQLDQPEAPLLLDAAGNTQETPALTASLHAHACKSVSKRTSAVRRLAATEAAVPHSSAAADATDGVDMAPAGAELPAKPPSAVPAIGADTEAGEECGPAGNTHVLKPTPTAKQAEDRGASGGGAGNREGGGLRGISDSCGGGTCTKPSGGTFGATRAMLDGAVLWAESMPQRTPEPGARGCLQGVGVGCKVSLKSPVVRFLHLSSESCKSLANHLRVAASPLIPCNHS
jgi:hypothetical protein